MGLSVEALLNDEVAAGMREKVEACDGRQESADDERNEAREAYHEPSRKTISEQLKARAAGQKRRAHLWGTGRSDGPERGVHLLRPWPFAIKAANEAAQPRGRLGVWSRRLLLALLGGARCRLVHGGRRQYGRVASSDGSDMRALQLQYKSGTRAEVRGWQPRPARRANEHVQAA